VAGARQRRSRHETGAGITSDDDDTSEDGGDANPTTEELLENQIEGDIAQNIRHQPVKVARHHSPFEDPDVQDNFLELLDEVLSQPEHLPDDYGILEDEWEDDDYPEIESIKPGTNGKELIIVLPRAEWFPRAAQWVQALDFLTRYLHELQEQDGEESREGESDDDSDGL
jgi:hypothetical protein